MKYSDEYLIQETNKYNTKKEFREDNPSLYNTVQRRKLFDKTNIDGLKRWTKEELIEEALKYNIKGRFYDNSINAYFAARRMGILNDICSHMEKQYEEWTIEKLQEESIKYSSRGEFQLNSKAYKTAQSKGVLDKICSHMPFNLNIDNKREIYKNRKTILYYVKLDEIYKIGITLFEKSSDPLKIIRTYRYGPGHKSKNVKLEIIDYKEFLDGSIAFDNEQEILKMNKNKKYLGEKFITENGKSGGETECFVEDIYENIKSYLL